MKHYDYIFTGAGAAGLSLLARLILSGKFTDKKILVAEKDSKKTNDRTWCFWEKKPGFFDHLVKQKYSSLWFHAKGYSALNDISPYTYKLIHGIDFYSWCLDLVQQQENIEWLEGNVDGVYSGDNHTWAVINKTEYSCDYIFNSIIFDKPQPGNGTYYLLQHFKGWVIDCADPIFDPEQATLMDFRVQQDHGTCFVYVMPYSSNHALVEYTVFSRELLEANQYDEGLKNYIAQKLRCKEYTIDHEEFGVIPMTNHINPVFKGGIVNIGTAGNQTKASSGYTFNFIQKQSERILNSLLEKDSPYYEEAIADKRFRFYDSTLLNILYHDKLEGEEIFRTLFQKNKMTDILQFLDNESSIGQELRIINVLPRAEFLKAAIGL